MLLGPNDLPIAPVGDRVLVKGDRPSEKTVGGLFIPGNSMPSSFKGELLAAGLSALDKLHDNGLKIGDKIWWGKFAGVFEEWDHVIEGPHTLPEDSYDWIRQPQPAGQLERYKCANTGAVREIAVVFVMNVNDILGSESLAKRLSGGDVKTVHGQTADGKTQHFIARVAA